MTGEDGGVPDKKKAHRERHSGRKADKKKKTKPENGVKLRDRPDKERNPKAFALNSVIRAERRFRRGQDIQTKKQHIPLVDRAPLEPPPVMVAVVGPPKVGKTTLINCLIKNFTRQPLSDIKGPVTIVSGKKRRLTIMECNNDINCMIDLAKVADLVLLLVDASFGFEMEIFEFLNICQVHGMPRVMGVLTHLDMIKKSDRLKRTKKELKHRFWTEVYAGAKLFYLSGQVHGEYLRNEVKNLGRFISVMKFRPLVWRSTHPYLLADRMEDVTPPEQIRLNPKSDRSVCLYGYMRGIPLNKKSMVHIPGCGDLRISDVSFLPDPCPLPSKEKKRSLVEKEKFIYAPFSGVGGIVYDKDAVYVDLGGSHSHSVQEDNNDRQAQRELVSTLLQTQETLDEKMKHSELQLFTNTKPITGDELEQKSGLEAGQKYEVVVGEDGRERRRVLFTTNVDEDNEESSSDGENGTDQEDWDEDEVEEGSEEEEEEEEDIEEDEEGEEDYEEKEENSDFDECRNESGGKIKPRKGGSQVLKNDGSKKLAVKKSLGPANQKDSSDEFEFTGMKPKSRNDRTSQQSSGQNLKKRKAFKEEVVIHVPEKKKKTSGCIVDNSDDEMELGDGKKIHPLKESDVQYNKLSLDKGSDIRSKIADALSMLEKGSKEKGDIVFSDEDANWSFDEDSEGSDVSYNEGDFVKPSGSGNKSDSSTDGDDSEGSGDEEQLSSEARSAAQVTGGNNSEDLAWEDSIRWKSNLQQKAADAFIERQASTQNLWKLVYGKINEARKKDESESDEEVGGLFRVVSRKQHQRQEAKTTCNAEDCSRFRLNIVRDWTQPEIRDLIRDCFVTGKWKDSEDAEELLRLDDASDGDEELFGDFEDLETGEKFTAPQNENGDSTETNEKSKPLTKKEIMEKKMKLKEKFDAEYDEQDGGKSFYDELKAEVDQQALLNKSEFEGMDDDLRVQLEGYRAGMYVRIELAQVPCELIQHFDPTYPLVVGGLLTGEENIGYVQVRMKKHRWYKRILKTRDPLIISLGWRRFQSLPIYAKLEDNMRHRMLKYTPEHVACMGHFWGPITPQSTGFLAVQDVASRSAEFRIAATGVVVEQDKSTQITKKLKLTGVPLKVYKKTAFIKDMFTSSLEVARFEGAKIKTVSGIRGQIKKACTKPEGVFRATFEDKIQLSDIVFCRTWYKVDVPQLYNPVTSLLLPPEQKDAWRGMKTTGQLKRERGIQGQAQKDSLYTNIVREPKVFRPLVVPRALQKELPYRDRPKSKVGLGSNIDDQRIAVVREAHEQKVDKLMTMLKTNYSHKQEQLKKATHERIENLKKEKEMEESRKMRRTKELRREVFKTLSKIKKVDERRAAKGGKR
ncbi:Ribosome biogenesis protein BMS1-like protein [Frankliniella fusca]|uniref:Ribosome biogenesis protein BMS1-like protein n=1 Tax=Frankliniella fusca TaxID=407009 RepID=A0AAE1I415_9NEOP|nr:Ribosome biogenesis protein BMS1-like protein [Frankliniella fusca]